MRALNLDTGRELAGNVAVADSLFTRARGLLGRRTLPPGEGLLIRPCQGVHTIFMRFAIDVVFLDKENRIVATVADLQPYRMTKLLGHATSVLELPAGALRDSGSAVAHRIVFL